MKISVLVLATLSVFSFSLSATAQEQLTDPSTPKVSGHYSKFADGSLSYSTGGCSSYGYACSYSTTTVVPSTFEAAQYVASLPKGDYVCEIYYGTRQPTVTDDTGRKTTYFAPALYCQTPPPKPTNPVVSTFPPVRGVCVGDAAEGFDSDSIVSLNHYRYEDGKAVLGVMKAQFVDPDANLPPNEIVSDVKFCPADKRAYLIDTVRWISSDNAPEGYVQVELTQKDYPYQNLVTGLLKRDQSASLNQIIEESRLTGGKPISVP